MSATNELNFDSLDLATVPVTIAGTKYVLREATAAVGRDYRNKQMRATKITAEGKFGGMDDLADLDAWLVSSCLFMEEGMTPVTLGTVLGWPDKVVKALNERAKAISDLDKGDKETVIKNGSSATTGSSV